MPILNQHNFPVLDSSDGKIHPDLRDHSIVFEMRPWNDLEYWYAEFKFNDSFYRFPLETWIPDSVLQRICNREVTLMLVNFHESFPDSVKGLYEQLIVNCKIPPSQIILGSGNPDMILEVKKWANFYSVEEIKVEWFLELEYALWEQKYRRPGFDHRLKTLTKKSYPKSFLNFNRRWRMHRPTMVGLLAAENLLDKGYVSLGKSDDDSRWHKVLQSVIEFNQDEQIRQKLRENFKTLLNLTDMYLDTNDLVTNRSFLQRSTDWYYENTYFSLVSETNYYTDSRVDSRGRFITEKTFKCIALEHPFVLITAPNSLPLLHKLGYKTFSPWIDESYDTEIDDYRRLELIVKEVKRLCSLTEAELDIFLIECKKICEHNLANLMSKKRFTYKVN